MSTELLLKVIDRALAFQDSREPKYRALETETVDPLLPAGWLTYADLREIQLALRLRNVDAKAALKTAIDHIEHMALWITAKNDGYSFEAYAEDMPGIRAAYKALAGKP